MVLLDTNAYIRPDPVKIDKMAKSC